MRVIAVLSYHDKMADILSALEGFEANEFND
jgi:hypothetical protein